MREQKSESIFHYFKTFDIVAIIYFIILSLLIVFFHHNLNSWQIHLGKHIAFIFLIVFIVLITEKFIRFKIFLFFRYWYLILAISFIYWDVGNYIHLIFREEFDFLVQQLEYSIFGFYPNVAVQSIYNPVLNEIMQLGYAIYWFTIPVSAAILFFKKKYIELEKLLSVTFGTFFLCYIIFILFPVAGPRFNLVQYFNKPYEGILFTSVLRKFVHGAGLRGGAFPSSHVAVSFVIYRFMKRIEPKIAIHIFLPAVILLSLATVYGRYHYFLDMFAGLIMGFIISECYLRYCDKKEHV